MTRVDSVAKADRAGIAEQVQGIIGAIGKEKENFYAHPNNMIDNELGFHQLLISLYGLFYEDTKSGICQNSAIDGIFTASYLCLGNYER